MILGLFPGLSMPGGVQRAGGLTAAVLASFAKWRDEPYTFLSLNDPADTAVLQIGSQEIAFTGFGRSKGTFLRAALRAAFKRPSLVVALHPNLAPVVAAVKMFAPRTRSIIFAHGVEVWAPLGPRRRTRVESRKKPRPTANGITPKAAATQASGSARAISANATGSRSTH